MSHIESARRAEQEFGAEIIVIKKTSPEYAAEKDAPPCPSVKVNDSFLVRKGMVTYEQLTASLLKEGESNPGTQEKPTQAGELGVRELNLLNQKRYAVTAWFYDILDYPWERQYRKWRPELLKDVRGEALEAGVGTGRNLKYYASGVNLTAMDFSPAMLKKASKRCSEATCNVKFVLEDASQMATVPSNTYDWVVAFFLCCVLPHELQDRAISEFARVLKPGGRFRLLEMKYSGDPKLRKRQDFFAPLVAKVYGAGFDRQTLMHLQNNANLTVTGTRYIKHDTYVLIDGIRIV